MRKKTILLSGLVCLSVLIAGVALQSTQAEFIPTQVGYFSHVVDTNGKYKAWIYIMNIGKGPAKYIIHFIKPDETLVKEVLLTDYSVYSRVAIRVFTAVAPAKSFDGTVVIYSDQPFVATLQSRQVVFHLVSGAKSQEIWEIQIRSEEYSPPL